MPWPLVPPDADFPAPTRRDPDGDWFATRVEMTGLIPYKEQGSIRFTVGGKDAAVWLPVERTIGTHHYAGVLISTAGSNTIEAAWLENGGRNRSYPLTIKQVSGQEAQLVTVRTAGDARKIEVSASASGNLRNAHLVVAPFTDKMPSLSGMAEYQATGGWAPIQSGKASVTVMRRPEVSTYAVFVALGVPDKMQPISAVRLVE